MELIVTAIVAVIIFFALYMASGVTYYTVMSDSFDPDQKVMICLLAWLVPIVGPVIVLTVLASDMQLRRRYVPLLDFLFLAAVFTVMQPKGPEDTNSFGDTSIMRDSHDGGDT